MTCASMFELPRDYKEFKWKAIMSIVKNTCLGYLFFTWKSQKFNAIRNTVLYLPLHVRLKAIFLGVTRVMVEIKVPIESLLNSDFNIKL